MVRSRALVLAVVLVGAAALQPAAVQPSIKTAPSSKAAEIELSVSKCRPVLSFEDAVPSAQALRDVFEERMSSPRNAQEDSFAWDPWHVQHSKGDFYYEKRDTDEVGGVQYDMLRCQAQSYFPDELFDTFCKELGDFGLATLGCDSFTPPWVSLYLDGNEMNWHTDPAHGPFAFVLNLTPDGYHAREGASEPAFFNGGETVILNESILDYWRGFSGNGLEHSDIYQRHDPSPFGRLLCFDGRLPHSVSRVRGTRSPLRGRLVLTGWFATPRPTATGCLSEDGAISQEGAEALEAALDVAYSTFEACDLGRVLGFLAIKIHVNKYGTVTDPVVALADTLRPDPKEASEVEFDASLSEEDAAFASAPTDVAVRTILAAALKEAVFPAKEAESTITLPIAFD